MGYQNQSSTTLGDDPISRSQFRTKKLHFDLWFGFPSMIAPTYLYCCVLYTIFILSSLEDFFVYNWEFIILLFHTFSFTTTQIKYILQSQYKVIRIVVCTRDVNEMEALQQYNTWLLQYTEEIENFKIEVQFAQLGNFKHTASSISEIMKWSFANL